MQQLKNIRIVLVEPQHPGNIGAAARAMKAMGLSDLALVTPRHFPHADATARAAGADDILASAEVSETLGQAVAGCRLVIGASARARRLDWQYLDARRAAVKAFDAEESVAMVFGRERSGLTNEELELCHSHLIIPANPDYSSLNLAAAVQVACYELRMASLAVQPASEAVESSEQAARSEDVERFYTHLQEVLIAGEFLDPQQPKLLMRRLRRLFNRAHLEETEVNILRGILTALDPRKKH